MDQREINEREWRNPDNWNCGFYFSRRDSRWIVPKRIRLLGFSANLGRRGGAIWFWCVIVLTYLSLAVPLWGIVVLLKIIIANLEKFVGS